MDDKQSILDALMRQTQLIDREPPSPLQYPPKSNCCTEEVKYQGYFDDRVAYTITPREMSEGHQVPYLKINELSTIRKLLEQCTIDGTRREVIHVLEVVCSHPEECIDCSYKNSLGECNRNERIADILLNRFGRVK